MGEQEHIEGETLGQYRARDPGQDRGAVLRWDAGDRRGEGRREVKGPKLAIVASCQGCEHTATFDDAAVCRAEANHRWFTLPSGHPAGAPPPTPVWCPLLRAATVAHARELLAPTFTKALAKAIHESDNGMGSGDLHELLASIGGEPHDPEAS